MSFQTILSELAELRSSLCGLATKHELQEMEKRIMATFATAQEALDALMAKVDEQTTVEKSALALIQGIPALITAAVAKAQAAGATPEQLQAFSDLTDKLTANDTELSAAVTANTPAA